MRVGGLDPGVGQAVLDRVEDQLPVPGDGLGELDEGGESAALGPGDPAGQQRPRRGQIAAGEDLPELLVR